MYEIINADFRESIHSDYKEGIIITDPPYNIGFEYNEYNDDLSESDYIELIRELKDYPLAIIHYPEETMKYFVKSLGVPDEVNVWCYNSNLPGRHSRLINYYNVSPDYRKVLQPYKNPNDKRIKKLIQNGSKGTRSYDWFSDIQLVKNVSKKEYYHPCPVPVKLMERIIELTTNVGDLVIDPFMGSGTTGVAALNTGRRFLGYEIDTVYFETASNRLSDTYYKMENKEE